MNKQIVLKFGKIEDIRRDKMYRDYIMLLTEKKKEPGKTGSVLQNRLALK